MFAMLLCRHMDGVIKMLLFRVCIGVVVLLRLKCMYNGLMQVSGTVDVALGYWGSFGWLRPQQKVFRVRLGIFCRSLHAG